MDKDLRGYFSQDEAEDAGILTDSEDDKEVLRKIDRKGYLLFIRYRYYINENQLMKIRRKPKTFFI